MSRTFPEPQVEWTNAIYIVLKLAYYAATRPLVKEGKNEFDETSALL